MIYAFLMILIGAFLLEDSNYVESYTGLIFILTMIYVLIMCVVLLIIEQLAGYYECRKCKRSYVPKFMMVFWYMHICRSRYMKCPKCGKWSWNKKVLK